MTYKKQPPPAVHLDPPCAACYRDHRLSECATPEAVRLLESAGLVMSADKVRRRIGGAA